jgi:hypothetical protein
MRLLIGIAAGLALGLSYPGFARACDRVQSESAQKPDFSGVWQPDPAKMTRKTTPKAGQKDLPPPPPPDEDDDSGPPSITIQHKDQKISITTSSADGEDVSILNLTTDGQENTNPVDEGNTYNKSKSHWEDGKLITEWTVEQYGKPIFNGRDVRWLSEDGKMMIVETRLENEQTVTELHQELVRKGK